MRIVIDMQGAQTESRYRGIGRYSMSFVRAVLRNRGEHEFLIALSDAFPETIEPIRAELADLLPQDNIRVWSVPGQVREDHPNNEVLRDAGELVREAFLAKMRPDVIHVCSLFEGYVDDALTSIGRLDSRTPVTVSLYDLIPLLNPEHYLSPNRRYESYYLNKVEHLGRAARLLAISEFSRQEGLRHLGGVEDRYVNVSTAIDASFGVAPLDDIQRLSLQRRFGLSRPFVLYTGGADERKNLLRLVEAFASLPPELRDAHHLVLAGKIPESETQQLVRMARRAGLDSKALRFSGYVSDDELVALYNECELFVFPSWHEGFGLPVLEAMACGAPTICANTTSLPEVVGLDEAMFDPYDTGSISSKIRKALSDGEFRKRLRANGSKQASLFSWDSTARRAIAVWEAIAGSSACMNLPAQSPGSKPTLAFVSPLPPARSGIADYSADLLPALSKYYRIELVIAQDELDRTRLKGDFPLRDAEWLRSHRFEIDRVLYQFGNSPFHEYMLDLLKDVPGAVVLHDFYLSGLMSWLETVAFVDGVWEEALYRSHGYPALRDRKADIDTCRQRYPSNMHVLQHAQGVIVHSGYSARLANDWYGTGFSSDWEIIPLVRELCAARNRNDARRELGFADTDFIVCSFGFLDPTKLNHRLLDAWLASTLKADRSCKLIFVGENHAGDYGANLIDTIRSSGLEHRIRIVGFVAADQYQKYLVAADLAVQLRTSSRGETSAAVLDCMGHGLPVIANANGSMAELDRDAVLLLPDAFNDRELTCALETLWQDPARRAAMSRSGVRLVQDEHAPDVCAKRYAEAIERFHRTSMTDAPGLIRAIAEHSANRNMSDVELARVSKAIAASLPLIGPARKLLLDVTATSRHDRKTGIERVARALVLALLELSPPGYRVEPVYLSDEGGEWHYRYARDYTLGLIGCSSGVLADEPVEPEAGDLLLGLDLSGETLVQAEADGLFMRYRNRGVRVFFTVFDLLPVEMPHLFPPGADEGHSRWLSAVSKCDGAVCISQSVADSLRSWLPVGASVPVRRPFEVHWVHLGADIDGSAPTLGLPDQAPRLLETFKSRMTFLMVGTIEPRKAYRQAIEAFTLLWNQGVDVNLAIVGREGWTGLPEAARRDIPETVARLRTHPEQNRRLFWLGGASDEFLAQIYETASCLVAASYGEGFGLPLIEAARHNLPIIARDIPVFREVAGEHASYFTGFTPNELAQAIGRWVESERSSKCTMLQYSSWQTWKGCATQVLDILTRDKLLELDVARRLEQHAIKEHLNLIHVARIDMVRSLLPQGDIILDLGGANSPLYKMGYRHKFKRLYLIDLPPEARCDMYKEVMIDPSADGGEVVIKYSDMTHLSEFEDESVDLVWSGQSIEHVPREAGQRMCEAAYRVLKQGGSFCLDTPNRIITKIHTRDSGGGYIHPEHCIEYEPNELRRMLERAGFAVRKSLGVCEMKSTSRNNEFKYADFSVGKRLSDDVERCYIQFFHCVKI